MYAVLLLLGAGCACALAPSVEYYAPEQAERYFEEFITKFNKKYASDYEKEARFQIFKENLENVNRLNENSEHTVYGITMFLDLTVEEFIAQYTGLRTSLRSDDEIFCDTIKFDEDIEDANAPEAFDWRDHNAVTRVKDQGACGSCWAFSLSGHIEGQYAIKHGELVEFSEQQHIECDTQNNGCDGGFMSVGFKELKKLGGPMKEVDYPYISGLDNSTHECMNDKSKIIAKALDCITYNLTSQEKVKQLLFKVGPLPVAMKSAGLQGYTRGILKDDDCDSGPVNHGVLLVGYGTENGVPYWIVKNSHGTKEFGEDGYFRMERKENRNGACGMLNVLMATLDLE